MTGTTKRWQYEFQRIVPRYPVRLVKRATVASEDWGAEDWVAFRYNPLAPRFL